MKIIAKLVSDGIIKVSEKEEIIIGHCPHEYGFDVPPVISWCDKNRCPECWNREVEEQWNLY